MIKTFVRAALDEQNTMKKAIVDSVSYIGCVIWCAGNVTPDNTIYCDGSAVSRTTYAELFDAIGTTYGAGDGSSTFNIPDLRGYFIRGTGGNAAALGAEQGDAMREIYALFTQRPLATQNQGNRVISLSNDNGIVDPIEVTESAAGTVVATVNGSGQKFETIRFRSSRIIPTAEENRPINYAMRPCIIYQ